MGYCSGHHSYIFQVFWFDLTSHMNRGIIPNLLYTLYIFVCCCSGFKLQPATFPGLNTSFVFMNYQPRQCNASYNTAFPVD